MSEARLNFQYCDELVAEFEEVCEHPIKSKKKEPVYYTGVDLGTACVVVAVLDEDMSPVAGCYKYADVVRDGMVVDYVGAVQIVREMKQELEQKLGVEELIYAAAAIPPGTESVDSGAVENVCRGAGFTVSAMLTGLIFGFAFYGRKVSLPRVIIAWFINAVAVEILLFAFWFTFSGMAGDQSYWVIVVERLIMEGIKCVPEIMLIFGVGKLVERIPLKKFKIKKQ